MFHFYSTSLLRQKRRRRIRTSIEVIERIQVFGWNHCLFPVSKPPSRDNRPIMPQRPARCRSCVINDISPSIIWLYPPNTEEILIRGKKTSAQIIKNDHLVSKCPHFLSPLLLVQCPCGRALSFEKSQSFCNKVFAAHVSRTHLSFYPQWTLH